MTQEHIINFISNNTSYQIEAKCRKNRWGGGVCIFIKSNIEYRIIKTPNDIESIGIQIELKNEKLNIYGYYNPPNRNIDLEFIKAITTGPNKFIIAGDLNARTSLCKANKTNKNGRDLDNILIEQNCFMLNDTNQDTYVRYNKDFIKTFGSVLDYIISDPFLASKAVCSIVDNDLLKSDHLPISCDLDLENSNQILNNKTEKKNIIIQKN